MSDLPEQGRVPMSRRENPWSPHTIGTHSKSPHPWEKLYSEILFPLMSLLCSVTMDKLPGLCEPWFPNCKQLGCCEAGEPLTRDLTSLNSHFPAISHILSHQGPRTLSQDSSRKASRSRRVAVATPQAEGEPGVPISFLLLWSNSLTKAT